jgi:hypothetical protein
LDYFKATLNKLKLKMKKFLIYSLIMSVCSLGFYACNEEEDDDPIIPQTTTPTNGGGGGSGAGSGGGAGTGGGTGSGGIPPNSMQVTVNGNVLNFDSVMGSVMGNEISILGISNNDYPRLLISLSDSLMPDTFRFPAQPGEANLNYQTNSSTIYTPVKGFLFLRTIDSSRSLVNGRFEAVLENLNNAQDSVVFTAGQFNKFYN